MVTTLAPSQEAASVVQDLTARPSRWTTQAPHWLVSQPTCVPVRRRFSRRNWTSNVLASTSAVAGLPFTVMLILTMRPPGAVVVALLSAAVGAAAGAAAVWEPGAGSAGFFSLRNRENMTSSSLAPRLGRTQTIVRCGREQLRHSSGLCAIASGAAAAWPKAHSAPAPPVTGARPVRRDAEQGNQTAGSPRASLPP